MSELQKRAVEIIVSKLNPAWFDHGDAEAIALAEEIIAALHKEHFRLFRMTQRAPHPFSFADDDQDEAEMPA